MLPKKFYTCLMSYEGLVRLIRDLWGSVLYEGCLEFFWAKGGLLRLLRGLLQVFARRTITRDCRQVQM